MQGTFASDERLRWLEEHLSEAGRLTIVEAALQLGVSEMTIRRDLAELEGRGTVKRVRGGARAIGPRTFSERHSSHARAKARVATKLATLMPDSGWVAFDASSTVMRLAPLLDAARDLSVLTNGPETFAALQDRPGVRAFSTGGELESRTGSLVGALACRAASQLSVQTFFTSAAALEISFGASEASLAEAEVKRQMAAMATRVVLAVDSSKLDARSVATALRWDLIDVLVTELDPHDKRLGPFRALASLL